MFVRIQRILHFTLIHRTCQIWLQWKTQIFWMLMLFFVACHMGQPRFFIVTMFCMKLFVPIVEVYYYDRLCCRVAHRFFFLKFVLHYLIIYIFYQEIIKGLPRQLKIVDLSAVCPAHLLIYLNTIMVVVEQLFCTGLPTARHQWVCWVVWSFSQGTWTAGSLTTFLTRLVQYLALLFISPNFCVSTIAIDTWMIILNDQLYSMLSLF
jgi:hypothetical protein